jgi:DNA primase
MLTALHHFKKQELMIRFAFLPKDQDPDSIVRERGAEAIEKILAEALPLSTWVLETICSPSSTSSVEDRTVATKKFREIFKKMTPGIFKTQLTREVCNRLGCSTEEILGKNNQNVVRVKPIKKRPKTEITAEFQMLKVLIRNPAYLEKIKIDDESWFLEEYSPILEFLKETLKNADTTLGFDGVIEEFNKKKGDLMGTSIAAFEKASLKDPVLDDILSKGGELNAEFDFLLTTLKIKELEHLTSKLSAEPNIDGKKIKELRTEIVKLKNAQIK